MIYFARIRETNMSEVDYLHGGLYPRRSKALRAPDLSLSIIRVFAPDVSRSLFLSKTLHIYMVGTHHSSLRLIHEQSHLSCTPLEDKHA